MIEILKRMSFQGVMYDKLTDPQQISQLEKLAAKLSPLQKELISSSEGRIEVRSSGNVMVSDFDNDLSRKINQLI